MRRYKNKRTYAWSPTLAYCVGLLTTDGSLSKDNRHIDFTSKDYELTQIYQSIVCPRATIGTKKSGDGNIAYRVQLGDVALYEFLLSIGLTQRKSRSIGALDIPDEFYADFLRGCFDGDGTTYGFRDIRWKNSYMYYVGFCSASAMFLDWLHEQNIRLAETEKGSKQQGVRVNVLIYAKRDSKKLHDYMYYNDNVPYLGRKRKKLLGFFATDPYL